jgi:hypothetical protein
MAQPYNCPQHGKTVWCPCMAKDPSLVPDSIVEALIANSPFAVTSADEPKTKSGPPSLCELCSEEKPVVYQVVPEGTCGELHVCAEHLAQAVDKCIEWDAQVARAGTEAATVIRMK